MLFNHTPWYRAAEGALRTNPGVLYLLAVVGIVLTVWFVWIQPSKLAAAAWITYLFMP